MADTRALADALTVATEADHGVVQLAADGATTAGLAVQGSDARLAAAATHVADSSAAHAASAVAFTPASGIAATDVQAAIVEDAGDLAAHLADTTAAHAASAVAFTPTGTIAATDVQAAIAEVASEAAGGFANPMTTQDDLILGGASGTPDRLAKGTDGQVLTVDPITHHLVWATPSAASALTVEEVDGSPTDAAITTIKFPNGTLGIAAHVATFSPVAVAPGGQTLTDGATINWNLASGSAYVVIAGDRDVANPTNLAAGEMYFLLVEQGSGGNRHLTFGDKYFFPSGALPALSTAAGRKDLLTFVSDGTQLILVSTQLNMGPYVPFSANSISGLKAWYDASQLTGLADGDAVSSWANLAPATLGSYAMAASGSGTITYKTAIQNGRAVLRQNNNTRDMAATGLGGEFGSTGTIAIVFRWPSTIGGGTSQGQMMTFGTATDTWWNHSSGVGYWGILRNSRLSGQPAAPPLSSGAHMVIVRSGAGGWRSRKDGATLYDTTASFGMDTNPKLFGERYDSGVFSILKDICEFAAWSNEISDSDLALLESEWNAKWGVY